MLINEELRLLIKSKYPVVFLESIDEEYVIGQLKLIANQLDLIFYQWSITGGLQRADRVGSFYQTKDAAAMIKMVLDLVKSNATGPGLFVLKDFDRHLKDGMVLRLFKDLVNSIRNTMNTVVIVAPEYQLPKDIEPDAAHIVGGYPNQQEIRCLIENTLGELQRHAPVLKVSLSPADEEKIIESLQGLSTQQIRSVLNQCVMADNTFNIADLGTIESFKKKIFDNEGMLEFCAAEIKETIANFDNIKRWVAARKGAFAPNKSVSLPPPKGVLLMGVQGCGKSSAIKIIAQEFALPLYRLELGRLYSQYIGQTEQNLRKALLVVEKLCPLCLWIDEIEKGFAASDGQVDGGVSQRVLGAFLTWMQERQARCFLAATANNVYALSPELLRKGRFDEIFFVDLPDAKTREAIFQIQLGKRGLNPRKFDCRLLAESSADFSGAEIEQAVISALYSASTRRESLSSDHVIEQTRTTKPLSVLKQEEISALREWAKDRTIAA